MHLDRPFFYSGNLTSAHHHPVASHLQNFQYVYISYNVSAKKSYAVLYTTQRKNWYVRHVHILHPRFYLNQTSYNIDGVVTSLDIILQVRCNDSTWCGDYIPAGTTGNIIEKIRQNESSDILIDYSQPRSPRLVHTRYTLYFVGSKDGIYISPVFSDVNDLIYNG